MEEPPDIVVTEPELALGFSAQTLIYPEGAYELSNLHSGDRSRLDRTAALGVDATNRLRRRHGAAGYLHERFNGATWDAAGLFETLDDVAGSDVYRRYLSLRAAETGPADPPE